MENVSSTERLVADTVRRHGPVARALLARLTGLSQATVHRTIARLADHGILEFGDAPANGPGKPSPLIAVRGGTIHSYGLCVNTDTVSFALVDLTGRAHVVGDLAVDANDPAAVAAAFKETIRETGAARLLKAGRICGLGISMPGFRDGNPARFQTPRPLPAWRGIDVDRFFHEVTGFDVFVENNGACGALAELFAGHGVRDRDFGYLSFNYGFGGGIVLDGALVRGGHGNAGEIGKIYTNDQMRHRPALGELLQRLAAHGIDLERIADLRARFDPDWPGVRDWIAEVMPCLNLAIRAITAVMDPNFIVFGGEAPPALRTMLLEASADQVIDRWGRAFPMPTLKSSDIAGDPALSGAAFLAMKNTVFL